MPVMYGTQSLAGFSISTVLAVFTIRSFINKLEITDAWQISDDLGSIFWVVAYSR